MSGNWASPFNGEGSVKVELTDFQREVRLMLVEMEAKCVKLTTHIDSARVRLDELKQKRMVLEETLGIYQELHGFQEG